MKIYNNTNVYDAALNRIRYLFDEFPNIIVGISGGKDSTVVFNLAMIVAKEKNRLPLNTLWIDQEAEWQGTADLCQSIMESKAVRPYWFQMPMVITNNASSYERYSYCWDEKRNNNWIREKNDLSIKKNTYGKVRFHELFSAIIDKEFRDKKTCYIAGVRTEETPKRFVALTTTATYKWITWGTVLNKKTEHYTFYPIYDWSYTDVWKSILDNNWKYNTVYDQMYRYGVAVKDMRISNVHHETSKQALQLIHEIEPKTWNKIVRLIPGANTIHELESKSFSCPAEYPYMFSSWKEYCYYLADSIIQEEKNKILLKKELKKMEKVFTDEAIKKIMYQEAINTILSADWDLTKLTNFKMRPAHYTYRRWKQKKWNGIDFKSVKNNKFIPQEGKADVYEYFSKKSK